MTMSLTEHLDGLNNLADGFCNDANLRLFKPHKSNGLYSFTIIPDDVTAFSLNPIVAGITKDTKTEHKINNGCIVRILVSYIWAEIAVNNPAFFYYQMSSVINEGLNTLDFVVGNLDGRKVTARQPSPGNAATYFRALEDCAGYEFRLFCSPKEGKKQ